MKTKRHRPVHVAPPAVEQVAPAKASVNWLFLIIAAAAVVVLIRNLVVYRFFIVDDAFISFRYARNLAAGFGPTFNAGRPPIEGYTSFLWVVVMALPHLVGMDAMLFAKIFSGLCACATVYLLPLFTARFTEFHPGAKLGLAAALSSLLLASCPLTALHANSGMETALFIFLLTAFLYLLTLAVQKPSPRLFLWLGIMACLVALTRPEGNLPVIIGTAAACILLPRAQRLPLLARMALLYVLPIALFHLWRVAYYGHLFPLPFYVKVAHAQGLAGLEHMRLFAVFLGLPCLTLLLCALLRKWRQLFPALLAAVSLALFFLFTNHLFDYGFRYCYPLFPLACVIMGVGFAAVESWLMQAAPHLFPPRGFSPSAPSRSCWHSCTATS